MNEPTTLSTRPPDPSFWLIPGLFLRDTLVNAAMFICLAVAAFFVDWTVRWLTVWGLNTLSKYLLEGTSIVLLVCDVITFVAIQVFLVYQMIRVQLRP